MWEWLQTWGPEIIGYVGMAFVLSSFLMRNIKWLRILNIVGGTLSCIYGFITKTYPTAILNALLIMINVSMPIRWYIHHKKQNVNYVEEEVTEEK